MLWMDESIMIPSGLPYPPLLLLLLLLSGSSLFILSTWAQTSEEAKTGGVE